MTLNLSVHKTKHVDAFLAEHPRVPKILLTLFSIMVVPLLSARRIDGGPRAPLPAGKPAKMRWRCVVAT